MREGRAFREPDFGSEGTIDRIIGDAVPLGSIPRVKDKAKYFLFRYCPAAVPALRACKKTLRRIKLKG